MFFFCSIIPLWQGSCYLCLFQGCCPLQVANKSYGFLQRARAPLLLPAARFPFLCRLLVMQPQLLPLQGCETLQANPLNPMLLRCFPFQSFLLRSPAFFKEPSALPTCFVPTFSGMSARRLTSQPLI